MALEFYIDFQEMGVVTNKDTHLYIYGTSKRAHCHWTRHEYMKTSCTTRIGGAGSIAPWQAPVSTVRRDFAHLPSGYWQSRWQLRKKKKKTRNYQWRICHCHTYSWKLTALRWRAPACGPSSRPRPCPDHSRSSGQRFSGTPCIQLSNLRLPAITTGMCATSLPWKFDLQSRYWATFKERQQGIENILKNHSRPSVNLQAWAQQLQIEGVRGATGWPQRHPHAHAEAVEHGAAHHQTPEEQFLGVLNQQKLGLHPIWPEKCQKLGIDKRIFEHVPHQNPQRQFDWLTRVIIYPHGCGPKTKMSTSYVQKSIWD